MKEKYRRKVVGDDDISRERIVKESNTKYSRTTTIKKVIEQAILLECGHKISKVHFCGRQVPTHNTHCYECQWDSENRASTTIDVLKNKMLRSI